ncbi:MAG: endolytic transglycosylase MltG [Candidatus Eiseniibacteriota bacterium]
MNRGSPYSRPFRPRRWALLLLLAAGLAVAADLFLPAGPFPPRERHVVLVRRGETLREVGTELERVGVLRGTLGFQILARLMHLDRSIKAGQYSLRLGITVPALLHAFARGMSGLSLITIPEGLTTAEISVLLSNRLGVPIADFDSLAHHRDFLDSLGVAAPSIEGYLAPDTYEFLPGTSPEVAFRTMAAHQREVLLRAAAGRDSLPLSMNLLQILTLASIVESEAQANDERARIARVYLNRLQRHMRLQADPTVGYGLGLRPRSRLYLRQLKSDTPFNTYLFEGLPPGPICNPGRASVDAVINPQDGVKDLYFVARGNGRHLFAETYQQHLRNIARARSMIAGASGESGARPDTVQVLAPGPAPPSDSLAPPPAKRGAKSPAKTPAKTPARTKPKTHPAAPSHG